MKRNFHHHQHALVSLQKRLLCKNQLLQFECSEPLIRHLEKKTSVISFVNSERVRSLFKSMMYCPPPLLAVIILNTFLLIACFHPAYNRLVSLFFFISFFGLFVRISLDFCNSRKVLIQLGDSATERDLQVIIDKLNRKISMELQVCFLLVILMKYTY